MNAIGTDDVEVRQTVANVVAETLAEFDREQPRCEAIYLLGSLARGGFSPSVSDIDMFVVLGPTLEGSDSERVAAARSRALAHRPANDRVSIFWGSVGSLQGEQDGGRHPPFDRLDLLDNGVLLHGTDIRDLVPRPQLQELLVEGARFALHYFGEGSNSTRERPTPASLSAGLAGEAGVVALTKAVLFPARFLLLASTGQVAGNDASMRHYLDSYSGPDAELVQAAYGWRIGPSPEPADALALLQGGWAPLFCRFLDVYIDRLEAMGQSELSAELARWRSRLER